MEDSRLLFHNVVSNLHPEHDDNDELRAIAFLLLENIFGLSRTDLMAGKHVSVQPDDRAKLATFIQRINNGEPLQYVTGEASFFGRNFYVSPDVLIPRPETEEIVRVALEFAKASDKVRSPRILDIGTGSGCIPITLALELAGPHVVATDVSPAALALAKKNAARYGVNVAWINHDVRSGTPAMTAVDIVTSNPPYVTEGERLYMKQNVVAHEPHLALFVPDDDPLFFYKHILAVAQDLLKPEGLLVVEINERFGLQVAALFRESGLSPVVIVKDAAGKDRVVSGRRPV